MTASLCFAVSHESHVGHVRRLVAETAGRLGGDETQTGATAIVATELATNVARHGQGGELVIREFPGGNVHEGFLEIHALDSGPGMLNVAECLQDGFSTAGSAGTGLGAVRRLAGQFQIHSQPGKGTAVWVRMPLRFRTENPPGPDYGGISVAVRGEQVCGDAWDLLSTPDGFRVLVADGLGHGPFAEGASREAVSALRQDRNSSPSMMLQLMHESLKKTRGAAASLIQADLHRHSLTSAGVGNVTMRTISSGRHKTLPCDNGTLGASIRRISESTQPWTPGSLAVIHSDGIASQWNLADYPGLEARHPALIAGILFRDFRRLHDDSTVVVVRHPDR